MAEHNEIMALAVIPNGGRDFDPETSIPGVDIGPLADPPTQLMPLTAPEKTNEEILKKLISRIQRLHVKAERASALYVKFATRAGRLLLLAKQRVRHGEWQGWVESHCKFAFRTAQTYMRYARGLDEGRIEAQHAASLRSALSTLREQDGRGAGQSNPHRAASRGRKTPAAIAKKIRPGKEDRGPAATQGSADLADSIPDLMVWDECRQRFVSLTIQFADVTLADAEPAGRAHFRQSVKATIDVLSKYSAGPEDHLE